MIRKTLPIISVILFALLASIPAFADPGKPTFGPAIYADGQVWGTKAVTALPGPNENNVQSFDKLFVVTNSNNPSDQMPVGEAAPGNPDYNGGRWFTQTVEWTDEGLVAHGIVPVLTSAADIMLHYDLGHLTISQGSFDGGPPPYFLCPLLPVK